MTDYPTDYPTWYFSPRTTSGEICFPDGSSVFFQGEEAVQMDDAVEACESDTAVNDLLWPYHSIAEK